MIQAKKIFSIFFLLLFYILGGYISVAPPQVYASVTVTPATGGTVSADTTTGSYATLTGPTIAEGVSGDVTTGTIILTAPAGFIFNTGAVVTTAFTKLNGTKTCFTLSSGNATPTTTSITFTVTAKDGSGTFCKIVFSNIQIRPSSGTPLASGNITDTGTAVIAGMSSSTNLGTLAETAGAKNKLIITQQPSATAAVGTNFTTNPIVQLQDQFGNIETGDSTSTIAIAPVLSTSSCGGTAGSGSVTATPTSGAAISSGVMTYTAMQYSAAESIKLCFSSTGVTSTLSNTIIVGIVSITITSSGTVSYGTIALGTSKNTTTTGLNSTQTVQNNSTIPEDFSIAGQNAPCPWTLASTNGTNQYAHSFSLNSGSTWTLLTTSLQSLATNIAASGTQNFDLQLLMPSSTSCYTQQSINVNITATAH